MGLENKQPSHLVQTDDLHSAWDQQPSRLVQTDDLHSAWDTSNPAVVGSHSRVVVGGINIWSGTLQTKVMHLPDYFGLSTFPVFQHCPTFDSRKFFENKQGFRTPKSFAKVTKNVTKNKVRNPCRK